MSDETEVPAEKVKKSIVPAKYSGKYGKGGSDELATFINAQCNDEGNFSFAKFFALCRANGIAEEQVAKYEGQVEAKNHGAPGRARMTLRNMLASIVRKSGKATGNDGSVHDVHVPALPARVKAEAEAA